MSKPVIQIENLCKQYRLGGTVQSYLSLREQLSKVFSRDHVDTAPDRHFWALKDINFDVQPGESVAIIGKNGAGKSTLLKILSQITPPTTGQVTMRGRVSSLLEVGTGFHPELTGRENVYLNGAILGMSRAEIASRFDEIVAFAEVDKFLNTPVKRYSSGMQMRLAFAVAAHLDPEVLVVDEVLAVGDMEFQKKCLGKMEQASKGGRTVILVSHNMPSIMNLCERAVLLNKGQVVAEGPAEAIVQQYLASEQGAGGQIHWSDPESAPHTGITALAGVEILQDGVDGPTADVSIGKEILVRISYWCLQEDAALYAAIWLRDQMGAVVFSSSGNVGENLVEDRWNRQPHPVGLYQSVCRIPANFLNDQNYTVAAILGKAPNATQIFEDMALSFTVHDTGEMRQNFYARWVGSVRPRLAWETERLK